MNFKTLLGATAMAAASLLAVSASATTVTFDDLASLQPISNGYAGLNWGNFYAVDGVNYTGNPSGYGNGVVSPNNVAFNAFGSPAAFSSASPFTLTSFYLTAAWNDGLNVTVTGKLGGVTQHQVVLVVGTGGPTLESFNWAGIDEVDFSSAGGTNHGYTGSGTHFALDNLTINGGAVPEPATWAMMLMGFGALGLVARARRARAFA